MQRPSLGSNRVLSPLVQSTYESSVLNFYLNGTKITLTSVDPEATLLDFIRSQRKLKGTKLGCGEGGCGACTVVVQDVRTGGRIEHLAINACLAPILSVEGKHVITIEALGTSANPHPLQERIAKLHGSQCGFCTPGIVMSLYALLRNAYDPLTRRYVLSEEMVELEGALDGNLCRCTGYKPILGAAKSFVREDLGRVVFEGEKRETRVEGEGELNGNYISGVNGSGTGSCGRPGGCCRDPPAADFPRDESSSDETESSGETSATETDRSPFPALLMALLPRLVGAMIVADCRPAGVKPLPMSFNFKSYEPHTEIIFPPALRKYTKRPIFYGNENKVWFRPTTIEQLVDLKHAYPSAKIVAGSSEVQIELKFKREKYPVSVYIGDIEDLKGFSINEAKGEVVIGGNISLTVLEKACLEGYNKLGKRALVLEAIRKQLRYFGGRQIRNTATPAGNIVTASPISDLNPVFIASGAVLTARSKARGEFTLPLKEFFLAYRTTALPVDAIITKLTIPLPAEGAREVIKSYKQAKRKDDDIAIVTAGFRVVLDESGVTTDISLAYGGMAQKTVEAKNTMEALLGKKWFDNTTLEGAMGAMEKDFSLGFTVPGGMPTYRKTLAFSFLFRFWHEVAAELELGTQEQQVDREVVDEIHRGLSYGSRDNDNPYEQRVVGKQIPHLSGLKQATGEAEYIDDMPNIEGQLFGGLVLSKKAYAKLVKVDFTPALQVPGVVGYVDVNDLGDERNHWGPILKDDFFFAEDFVYSHGQPIGMVYAESAAIAQAAAHLVDVQYEELPPILTISEAISAKSFLPYGRMLIKGNPTAEAFKDCDFVFEGVSRMGGQEHFYLETNTAAVIPRPEDGEMEVWSSTQSVMETQELVAQVTGVPSSRIVAKVKRMGGAFGGKEIRAAQLTCILAVAAKKVGRPVRCMLNRDEDMMVSGQRNPFQAHWRVGVSRDGMLQVLDADVYNNAGYSYDASGAVMDRAITHIDACYLTPHVHLRGHVCKTNTHSNTAFRGFGAPQGQYIAECIMTAVADNLKMSVDELRWKNLYKEGELTPFLQPLEDWHVPLIITQLKAESDYDNRVQQVEEFNRTHKWKKRGISLIPTKFGLSFATALHLNQAGALVHIYHDGSVLLAHGGTEMGQGLYTKMCQIAAQELCCPLDSIFTSETSSNTVANTPPTAASSSSDLNGMAIQHACQQLNARLEPYRLKYGADAPLKTLAHAAYFDRVNLTANGFYKMPTIGYKWGNYVDPLPMYSYFTQGAAISEVELDVLTGAHTVLRTDIKMDVGRSINPAIDYGQIEGAFVQGQGLFTIEESLWQKNGELFTRGPGTYKIPGFADIPQVFNAGLLKGVKWANLRTIQSSKGIGEPPLFLGATVLFALREAVKAARETFAVDAQGMGVVQLDSPATAEKLRVAIGDWIVRWAKVEAKEGEKGFFVEAMA
ncbi:xanthine dehydrogenase [Tuber magnatum]|uniref:Xanthine dehydrogenase n=2 Tax=Tuber magnatum TaxID=42249 RepID=A0A317SEJ7_9PEZI|nr:xanthine dehydrogenase [Tuber magnatum]PWW71581.1 xanthine dehydrogenase [Tuber magnatum]